MRVAEEYIKLAIVVIRSAKDKDQLLQWWKNEEKNREVNGVVGPYERRLRDACRHHLAVISERSKPTELLPVRAKRR